MDANRKVAVGKIRYVSNQGGTPHEVSLQGAEFQIKFRSGPDSITQPLPAIDLLDLDPTAVSFVQDTTSVQSMASAISDVRGVSVLAKVFFNNSAFSLGASPALNLNTGFSNWAKEWSVTTKETYLHRGDALQ